MSKSRKSGKKSGSRGIIAWPVAYKWVAMGTFVMYTAVGSRTVTLAQMQDNRRPSGAGQSAGQVPTLPVRRFDIPPGLLGETLNAFQIATGLRIETVNEAIRSLSSPGVKGFYADEQALRELLANTGATHRFTAAGG